MAISDPSPMQIRTTKPDQERTPDLQQVDSIILEEGPRSRKEVVHYAIQSRHTGEFKGHSIGFRTKNKASGGWKTEPAKSFTLESEEQIRKATHFIIAACKGSIPDLTGSALVVPVSADIDVSGFQHVVAALSHDKKADVIAELLRQAGSTPDLLDHLLEQASRNPELFVEAAATLNLARYRKALNQLNRLVTSSNRESDFHKLLKENPWMFGSEYSEHLENSRVLTRGTQQDFVLRRTADSYIELVEIKTPLAGTELFRFDPSHKSYYAGVDLSAVLGQVQKYIEELDAGRYEIQSRDGEDTNKIRAKIIIGRDADDAQRQALRRLNGHLHRIEVLTFDQLLRMAGRVVSYLQTLMPQQAPINDLDDDIPF